MFTYIWKKYIIAKKDSIWNLKYIEIKDFPIVYLCPKYVSSILGFNFMFFQKYTSEILRQAVGTLISRFRIGMCLQYTVKEKKIRYSYLVWFRDLQILRFRRVPSCWRLCHPLSFKHSGQYQHRLVVLFWIFLQLKFNLKNWL